MKILVAGATGVIGAQLVPLLVARGHTVAGLSRHSDGAARLTQWGARPYRADALDPVEVEAAFASFRPDVVVNQLTALGPDTNYMKFEQSFAATNRLRVEGGRNLIAASLATGARRYLAHSFCGWPYARIGGMAKSESDPLDADPPAQMRPALDALRQLEADTVGAAALSPAVLRRGSLYGPGTDYAADGSVVRDVLKRRLPVVGRGDGVTSFLHVADAALATAHMIEHDATGVFNVVDDEPALQRNWLPALARIVGAPKPLHLPGWLMKALLPAHVYVLLAETRGGSNTRLKCATGWRPKFATWREGFVKALG